MHSLAHSAKFTATFTAGRRDLVGPDALLGTAEIARGVCHSARRRLSLLAITPDRMRRVDGWFTDDALVTHPVAAHHDQAVIGTVCARQHASELVGSIIQAMVGSVPGTPAAGPVDVPAAAALAPDSLPRPVLWTLIGSAAGETVVERWCFAAVDDGLVGASIDDLDAPVRLEPVGPIEHWTRIAHLLGDTSNPLVTPDVTATRGAPS